MNIIKTIDLEKSYTSGSSENKVLNKINLLVKRGEFLSIMGASGSGKSTLLNMISGMDNITNGEVWFDDKNLAILKEKQLADLRLKSMGFVFQKPTFLKNLNIFDNIIIPAIKSGKNKEEIFKIANELMKAAEIKDLANRNISEVSGGELQRAGICRALINSPKVLFCDEPTGALNSRLVNEIMDLLSDIHKHFNNTIILVTHDVVVGARADRVLLMSDGKIVKEVILKDINKNIDRIEYLVEKSNTIY